MTRPSVSLPRNPWVLIAVIAGALLLVGGAAFAFVNLGSGSSNGGSAGGVSLESCEQNRDPEADPAAFVSSGSQCFAARREAADGVWLSHSLAAATTTDSKTVRSWQISQAKNGDAAVVESGQTTAEAIPHIIVGDTDYVAAELHPAALWLADNAPNAVWVSHPAKMANWDAGRLNLIVDELLPYMGQWSGITNPDGSGLVTGYVDTANITAPWVAAVGAPVSVSYTRDSNGTLVGIMVAGKNTVHIWKTLEFKKTLLPPIPQEGIVESSKIPADEGAVIYDFFDIDAEIFIPGKQSVRPGPVDENEETPSDEATQGPNADDTQTRNENSARS